MDFPGKWTSYAADISRDEAKREASPPSFFFSQGHALVLAADYFSDDRLSAGARGGVAAKHRHRMHLALFGQLMAAFEFMFKDFVACVLNTVPTFDDRVAKATWIQVDQQRVLAFRASDFTPGALLIHPTMGWHNPDQVNAKYADLFKRTPIAGAEKATLERLWVLRHSVAHNAGFVTKYDALRSNLPSLAEGVVAIDSAFISASFSFLGEIAKRLAVSVGGEVVLSWLRTQREAGADYVRDKDTYQRLKLLATYVEGRTKALPKVTKGSYTSDYKAANPPGAA